MSATTAVTYDMTAIDNRAPNVGRQFFDRVRATPNREAYRYPKGDTWESQTWQETGDHVTKLAAGLVALGLEPEQRVGIASGTRYEWILADLAIMCAGAATTTVYPSTMADDVGYILADSECRVVFAEDDNQIAKLVERDHPVTVGRVAFEDHHLGEVRELGLVLLELRHLLVVLGEHHAALRVGQDVGHVVGDRRRVDRRGRRAGAHDCQVGQDPLEASA